MERASSQEPMEHGNMVAEAAEHHQGQPTTFFQKCVVINTRAMMAG